MIVFKAHELRDKTISELQSLLSDARRQKFKIRLMKASGDLTHVHTVKQNRRNIARLLTVLDQKKGNQ